MFFKKKKKLITNHIHLLEFFLLLQQNVFSTHSDRCSGHLSIIRNNEHYRELCFKIKDWKSKLLDDTFYALDEQDLYYLVYPETYFFYKVYKIE